MRRTENATYQPSRTVKHTVSPKGTVRRVSTAVLVDQTVRWDGVGAKARRTLVPPSAELLKGVHDIIAGITGFSEQRGDQITVETLPFESTLQAEPPMAPAAPVKPVPLGMSFRNPIVIGGAVLLALLTGGLVFILFAKRSKGQVISTSPAAIAQGATAGAVERTPGERRMEQQLSENDAQQAQLEADVMNRINLPPSTRKTEVLVKHIRDSVHKDSANATNVLRTWISEAETKRTT